MQAELYFDGRIQVAYLTMAAADGLVGLSNGGACRAALVETNFWGTTTASGGER